MTVSRRPISDTAPPVVVTTDEIIGNTFPNNWVGGIGASAHTGVSVSLNAGLGVSGSTAGQGLYRRGLGAVTTDISCDLSIAARNLSNCILAFPRSTMEGMGAVQGPATFLILDLATGNSPLFQQYQLEVMRAQLGALTAPEPYFPLSTSDRTAPEHLIDFEQYGVENWDGFDAAPITKQTLLYARKFVKLLPSDLGEPDAAPAADGSIALQWVPENEKHPLEKLFLDIGPGEEWRAYWTKRDGSKGRQPGTLVNDNTKIILEQLFKKLSV